MRFLFFIVLVLAFSFSVFGQKKALVKKSSTQIIVKEKEFDSSVDKLPPNFRGNNFQALLMEASDRKSATYKEKGEYETTAQYQLRLDKIKNAPFRSGLARNNLLAFVIDDKPVEKRYDADTETMFFSVRVFKTTDCFSSAAQYWWHCKSLQISDKHTDQGTYIAQNAFGVKIRVKKEHYMLLMLDLIGEEIPFVESYYNFSVKSKITDAPLLKTESRVLAVGYIDDSLINANSEVQKPTRDKPLEIKINYLNLTFKLRELWLFNQRTGEIYAKIKRTERSN